MSARLTQAGDRLLRDLAMSGEGTLCRPRSGADRHCMEALRRRGLLRLNTAADRVEWPYVLSKHGFEVGDARVGEHFAEVRIRELEAERRELRAVLAEAGGILCALLMADANMAATGGPRVHDPDTLTAMRIVEVRARAALRSPAGPSTDEDKPEMTNWERRQVEGWAGATDTKDED